MCQPSFLPVNGRAFSRRSRDSFQPSIGNNFEAFSLIALSGAISSARHHGRIRWHSLRKSCCNPADATSCEIDSTKAGLESLYLPPNAHQAADCGSTSAGNGFKLRAAAKWQHVGLRTRCKSEMWSVNRCGMRRPSVDPFPPATAATSGECNAQLSCSTFWINRQLRGRRL